MDSLVAEIVPSIETMMTPWLAKNTVNFASILMAGMSIVENFSSQVAQLSGADKLAVAKLIIPKLIAYSVSQGKLSQAEGDALTAKIASDEQLVENVISAYTAISNNPALVSAAKEVEAEVKSVFSGCCNHSGKK
jgi:hypothetical protein